MAKAKTAGFHKFLIMLGDGEDPEVFSAPCGLKSRSMSNTTNVNEIEVPDCDETKPSHVETEAQSQKSSLSGSGVLVVGDDFDRWRLWWESGELKNIRAVLDVPVGDKGGYYEGPARLTSFNLSASKGDKVNVDIELPFDGIPVWVLATE